MAERIAIIVYFIIYSLPIAGALYLLVTFLMKKPSRMKAIFSIFGILYGLFLISGLFISYFRPANLQIPTLLTIVYIVLFVPYLACVFGLYGLGYMGHGGISPSRIFSNAIDDIKENRDKNGK